MSRNSAATVRNPLIAQVLKNQALRIFNMARLERPSSFRRPGITFFNFCVFYNAQQPRPDLSKFLRWSLRLSGECALLEPEKAVISVANSPQGRPLISYSA